MLSYRDILRDVRRALKALPDHPSACEVTRVPGAGTQTIVVRDASGRPLLTHAATASFCCDAHAVGDGWSDTTHAAAVRAAMEGGR